MSSKSLALSVVVVGLCLVPVIARADLVITAGPVRIANVDDVRKGLGL